MDTDYPSESQILEVLLLGFVSDFGFRVPIAKPASNTAMRTSTVLCFPHFLISLAINHHVPGARLFDSEESRKPGNEPGKPIAKRLNTGNGQIKSHKGAQSFVIFAFFAV